MAVINNLKSGGTKLPGGDYDINVVDNDDGTQSLYITDSDSSVDRNATIKGLIERTATTFEIPEGTTKIGDYAFYHSKLTNIKIPISIKSIGEQAFNSCKSLTSITIPNSVTSIGNGAFNSCFSLTSITIPNSVTSIGQALLYGCGKLTNVTLPENMKSVPSSMFSSCSSLTSITIPEGVTNMGNGAFKGCSSLTSITIPEGVTIISSGLFYSCTKINSLIIPSGVTEIESTAFYDCYKLESLTLLSTTPPVLRNKNAFDGCGITTENGYTTIYIPAGTLEAYSTATNWSNFASKFVEMEA